MCVAGLVLGEILVGDDGCLLMMFVYGLFGQHESLCDDITRVARCLDDFNNIPNIFSHCSVSLQVRSPKKNGFLQSVLGRPE